MSSTSDTTEGQNPSYDVVVCGTHLLPSLVTASLALRGHSVLVTSSEPTTGSPSGYNTVFPVARKTLPTRDIVQPGGQCGFIGASDGVHEECVPGLYVETILESDVDIQKVQVDMRPLLIPCRGPLVETIARCGLTDYLDFVSIESLEIADLDDDLSKTYRVPLNMQDVMRSCDLSLIVKKKLASAFRAIAKQVPPDLLQGSETSIRAGKNLITPVTIPFQDPEAAAGLWHDLLSDFSDFPLWQFAFKEVIAGGRTEKPLEAALSLMSSVGRFAQPTPFVIASGGSANLAMAFHRLACVNGHVSTALDSKVFRRSCQEPNRLELDSDAFVDTSHFIDLCRPVAVNVYAFIYRIKDDVSVPRNRVIWLKDADKIEKLYVFNTFTTLVRDGLLLVQLHTSADLTLVELRRRTNLIEDVREMELCYVWRLRSEGSADEPRDPWEEATEIVRAIGNGDVPGLAAAFDETVASDSVRELFVQEASGSVDKDSLIPTPPRLITDRLDPSKLFFE